MSAVFAPEQFGLWVGLAAGLVAGGLLGAWLVSTWILRQPPPADEVLFDRGREAELAALEAGRLVVRLRTDYERLRAENRKRPTRELRDSVPLLRDIERAEMTLACRLAQLDASQAVQQ